MGSNVLEVCTVSIFMVESALTVKVPLKCWYSPIRLQYGVTTQKTTILIFITTKMSNLLYEKRHFSVEFQVIAYISVRSEVLTVVTVQIILF
jgi:hypothetical protein